MGDDKKNRYEEKVEAKRERYAERAAKARGEAASRSRAAHVIMDGIPMGQPVLVGHHSEKRHRKDLERIDTNLRKSAEASDKAAHYEHKAETYGTHGVSSDDPEAITKLRAQLAEREATRGAEKLWNRAMKVEAKKQEKQLGRALTQTEHVAIVQSLAMPEALKKALISYARAFPWLPQFGNGTQADIRRIEQRIAELERKAAQPEREPLKGDVDGVGYTIEWNKADNRVQIFFSGQPPKPLREKLGARGFKWARSVGAWQRHASEGAWYHARQIVGHKDPTISVCPGCQKPTHASESDDEGRCRSCAIAAIEHVPGCALNHCPHYECGPASGWCPACEEIDHG